MSLRRRSLDHRERRHVEKRFSILQAASADMFVAALSPRFLGAQRPAVVRMSAAELTQASSMRVKALKEELDERGVAWRGVAFEKDELVRLLEDARATPAPPSTAPSTPPPSPAAPAPSPPPARLALETCLRTLRETSFEGRAARAVRILRRWRHRGLSGPNT